jgi:hypothetical protein
MHLFVVDHAHRNTVSPSIDRVIPGQAITISQPHRKFGTAYAEFVAHAGDGKHVLVRKLISGMWRARWTKPLKVERAMVVEVHDGMARRAA